MRDRVLCAAEAADHPVPVRRPPGRAAAARRAAPRRARPFVASRLRSYDGDGDPARQARLAGARRPLAERLLRRWRATAAGRAAALVHLSPVLQGAGLARPGGQRALGIPYVIAEASHAAKRAGGAWDIGQRGGRQALRRADAVLGLNPADRAGVLPLLRDPGRWIAFPPFLDARLTCRAAPRTSAASPDRGGDDAAGRQARLLSRAGRGAGDADRSRLVARCRWRRRGPRRGRGGAGAARSAHPLARRARRGGGRRRSRRGRRVCLAGNQRGIRHGAARSAGERAAGRRRRERRCPRIVADGETGLLVPPGDPVALPPRCAS